MRGLLAFCLTGLALALAACRWQSGTPTDTNTDQYGGNTGSTYTAQCSGDFPDWISSNPPPSGQASFELAQAYPLGDPIFVTGADGQTRVDHWDPPAPNQDAPWRAYSNLSDATQRSQYLDALKNYFLENMSDPGIDFNAVKNNDPFSGRRRWFNVPMMTAVGTRRREPYHGVTSERALRPSEQTHWLNGSALVNAVAIGYYNELGGYTIGQVFKSYDLTKTDPTKSTFIDGALVFKLLFAQYIPARIIAPDPLAHSPSWLVQDPNNPANPPIEVRLLQVDVAVKDDHFSSTTGWVFATYVYDESQYPAQANGWKRLSPVGIQWGNDPTVTGTGMSPLNETWINAGMPAAFKDHLGRAGRLIGPVDNPVSACMSCHGTAEVDMAQASGSASAFMGAVAVPPSGCTDPMDWFRNLSSGAAGATPFGKGLTCPVNTATAGLQATDYSLQLQEALQSVFPYKTPNPCFASAKAYHDQVGDGEASHMMMARRENLARSGRAPFKPSPVQRVKLDKNFKLPKLEDDDLHRR